MYLYFLYFSEIKYGIVRSGTCFRIVQHSRDSVEWIRYAMNRVEDDSSLLICSKRLMALDLQVSALT